MYACAVRPLNIRQTITINRIHVSFARAFNSSEISGKKTIYYYRTKGVYCICLYLTRVKWVTYMLFGLRNKLVYDLLAPHFFVLLVEWNKLIHQQLILHS
jgi:hypothetical protein